MNKISKSMVMGVFALGVLTGCSNEKTNINKERFEQTPGILIIKPATIANPFKTSCRDLKDEISKDLLDGNAAKNTAISSHVDLVTEAYGTIAIAQYAESQDLWSIYAQKCLKDKSLRDAHKR